MPVNYNEGEWAPAYPGVDYDWGHGIVNDSNRQLAVARRTARGGIVTGSADLDNLESVQKFLAISR